MSVTTDYAKLNIEAFGKTVMRYHRTLDPILSDGDNLEVFSRQPNLTSALNSLQTELKKQKMLLQLLENRI